MSPSDAFYFGGLTAPIIASMPLLDTSKAVVNEVLVGDFTRLLIGLRLQMTVRILTERYADQLQIGFLCHLRADCAVEQPKSFCKVTLPAEAGAAARAEPMSIPDNVPKGASVSDQLVKSRK